MDERYRSDYEGEFIITNQRIVDGKKVQDREWIQNPIENQHISGRAVCIADGASRSNFSINKLENHRGGLLGKLRLQSYGVGRVCDEIVCNFYITRDKETLSRLVERQYTVNTVCYTSTRSLIEHPGEFYLLPMGQKGTDEFMAVWLACFDGHKEIYMIGYEPTEKVAKQIAEIMMVYKGVKFFRVSPGIKDNQTDHLTPESWKWQPNFQDMSYRQWITHCDI